MLSTASAWAVGSSQSMKRCLKHRGLMVVREAHVRTIVTPGTGQAEPTPTGSIMLRSTDYPAD